MPHAGLARTPGVEEHKAIVAEDGDQLTLNEEGCAVTGRVPAEYIYVHGRGDVSGGTLRDRQILGNDGVVSAMVCVDLESRRLVGGCELAMRGGRWGEAGGICLRGTRGRQVVAAFRSSTLPVLTAKPVRLFTTRSPRSRGDTP